VEGVAGVKKGGDAAHRDSGARQKALHAVRQISHCASSISRTFASRARSRSRL
jgi:hypothetical protein